jgi:hypothetical protein
MLGAGIRIEVSIDVVDGVMVDGVMIDGVMVDGVMIDGVMIDGVMVDGVMVDGVIVVNHSRHSSIFAEDKSNVVGLLSIYISRLVIISD